MEEHSTEKPKSSNKIKIIVLGSMEVGKTCLIAHYRTGKFLSQIPSTCGSSFVEMKKVIKGKKYTLNLWDTAGQEKYNSLNKIFTKNANIVILVYSIIDKKSFQSLSNWLKLVKETNGEDGYAIGVAANKYDLYKKSVVHDSQGQEYAKKIKAIWKSTSAKEDMGIEKLIDELLEIYLNMKTNNNNQEYIKLNRNILNKKQGGCCKGRGANKSMDFNMKRVNRINSKMSTISIDENNNNNNNNNNKDEDEDF